MDTIDGSGGQTKYFCKLLLSEGSDPVPTVSVVSTNIITAVMEGDTHTHTHAQARLAPAFVRFPQLPVALFPLYFSRLFQDLFCDVEVCVFGLEGRQRFPVNDGLCVGQGYLARGGGE